MGRPCEIQTHIDGSARRQIRSKLPEIFSHSGYIESILPLSLLFFKLDANLIVLAGGG